MKTYFCDGRIPNTIRPTLVKESRSIRRHGSKRLKASNGVPRPGSTSGDVFLSSPDSKSSDVGFIESVLASATRVVCSPRKHRYDKLVCGIFSSLSCVCMFRICAKHIYCVRIASATEVMKCIIAVVVIYRDVIICHVVLYRIMWLVWSYVTRRIICVSYYAFSVFVRKHLYATTSLKSHTTCFFLHFFAAVCTL